MNIIQTCQVETIKAQCRALEKKEYSTICSFQTEKGKISGNGYEYSHGIYGNSYVKEEVCFSTIQEAVENGFAQLNKLLKGYLSLNNVNSRVKLIA